MSTAFDERRRALEEKWAHDEELRFKVHVRRAKLMGLWAAAEMALKQAEADAYAKALVALDMSQGGDEEVLHKIQSDFAAKSIVRTDHLLRSKMEELLELAKEQVMTEG
ncbi:MAG: DUF1476 domain-containing protein [Rhizomicrobium sp.]